MRTTNFVWVKQRRVIVETWVKKPDYFRRGERLLHTPSGKTGTAIGFPGRGTGLVTFLFDGSRYLATNIHWNQFVRV